MKYKKELKSTGITMKKVAEKLSISQTMLSLYINEARPMPEHIEKGIKDIIKVYSAL